MCVDVRERMDALVRTDWGARGLCKCSEALEIGVAQRLLEEEQSG